jgi:signal peptidase I
MRTVAKKSLLNTMNCERSQKWVFANYTGDFQATSEDSQTILGIRNFWIGQRSNLNSTHHSKLSYMAQVQKDGSDDQHDNPQPPSENVWVEIIKTLGLSVVLAFGIRTFVAEARYIPSESMVPTLIKEDRLIVDKVSYHFKAPERGEIVVFMPPDEAAEVCTPGKTQPSKDAYIKRVIGLPGETIKVQNGQVFVNDRPLQENYVRLPSYQWGPKTVPQGSYLMLGDNRDNSCDSHSWGFVPRENIIGRAIVRFWPINRVGEISPQPTYDDAAAK